MSACVHVHVHVHAAATEGEPRDARRTHNTNKRPSLVGNSGSCCCVRGLTLGKLTENPNMSCDRTCGPVTCSDVRTELDCGQTALLGCDCTGCCDASIPVGAPPFVSKPDESTWPSVLLVVGVGCLTLFVACIYALCVANRGEFSTTPSVQAVCGMGGNRRSSMTLCALRLLVFVFQVSWLEHQLRNDSRGLTFTYFTNWNYLLQTAWWGIVAAASAGALCTTAAEPPPVVRRVLHVSLSVIVPAAFFVTICTFCVLLPHDAMRTPSLAHSDLNLGSYIVHAINLVCLLVECMCNRMLLHRAALPLLILWQLLFTFTTWIRVAMEAVSNPDQQGRVKWPYFFMDLSTWDAVGWYALLMVVSIACFAVVAWLSRLKASYHPMLAVEHFDYRLPERGDGVHAFAKPEDASQHNLPAASEGGGSVGAGEWTLTWKVDTGLER